MERIRCFGPLLFFCVILFGGCGTKTALIPPSAVIPTPITDLHFFQDESRVVLTWTYPESTTTGMKLNHIDSFQIFRAVLPEADYCETCPVSYTTSVEIPFRKAIKKKARREAVYTERVLRPGHRYLYKVRTKAGWHLLSKDSNTISFAWESPASAPDAPRIEVGDSAVTLYWEKVTALADGTVVTAPLKYQVYRGMDHDNFVPVGPVLSGNQYRDVALRNGQTYAYKIQAVREKENIKILGMSSRAVQATPLDQTAPVPPRGLKAVALTTGVKLLWAQNSEKDIAGYTIYRRSEPGLPWELRGKTSFGQLFFVDTIQAGQTFYYSITAFDQAREPNESLFAKELRYESF